MSYLKGVSNTISKSAVNLSYRDTPFLVLVLLCFFPIMPYGMMSVTIIAFCLLSVGINYNKFKVSSATTGFTPLVINSAFYILLALTIFYSENTETASNQIIRALPLLLFPLVFLYFTSDLTKSRTTILFGSFILANLVFIVYLFHYLITNASDFEIVGRPGLTLFEGLKDKGTLAQLTDLWRANFYEVFYYARRNQLSKIEIHKTYNSLNFIWCILILFYLMIKLRADWYVKLLQGLLIAVFTLCLIYLYSLINLFLLLVIVPIFVFILIKRKRIKVIWAVGVVLLGVFLTVALNNKQSAPEGSYQKYKEYENPAFFLKNLQNMLSNDTRNNINTCNLSLIESSPVFGIGIGDVQDGLDRCYQQLKNTVNEHLETRDQILNSHNYYAYLWIAGGIVVLLMFLLMLVYNMGQGIKNRDFLYLAFILIIALNLLTENVLGRAYGILFYSLWNGVFLYKNMRV